MKKVVLGLLVAAGLLGMTSSAQANRYRRGCYSGYRSYGYSCYRPYSYGYSYYPTYSVGYGCNPYVYNNYYRAYPAYYSAPYCSPYRAGVSFYGPSWGVRVGY